jgi:V/A-type H+-transporting ATPase subunit I
MILADILVLERHLHTLTTRLAEFGKVELIPSDESSTRQDKALTELDKLVSRPMRFLADYGIKFSNKPDPSLDYEEATKIVQDFMTSVDGPAKELTTQRERIRSINDTLPGLSALRSLDVEIETLSNLDHVILQYGNVPLAKLAGLLTSAAPGVVIIPLGDAPDSNGRQTILAASSRAGRFSLETLLGENSFHKESLPEVQGAGSVVVRALEDERSSTAERISELENDLEKIIKHRLPLLESALASIDRERAILKAINEFPHTESTARIRCWVPRPQLENLSKLVETVTEGTAVLETLDPISLPHKERSSLSIPVIMRNSPIFKPFETLIANYGYPAYGEIEPTPLVAIGFILMFGVMFGDIGQGFVLMLAGLFMALRKTFSSALRQAGILVAFAGISASFFGFVFGSFFCIEGIIHPLWHDPLAAFDNILVLFAATVAFGALWISTGLVCNIANKILFRDWEGVFLGKTGLAGLAFYWGAILPVAIMGLDPSADIGVKAILIACGIPLLIVMASAPLGNLMHKRPAFPHGFGTWFIEALIEGLDTVTWFFGNTFSFVRIGAFALAHGGLSLAVIEMTRLGGGGIPSAVIFVGGNLLIIILEGLVVTIQTLRLEYYEFFSKFYSGSGRPFVPFSLAMPHTAQARAND